MVKDMSMFPPAGNPNQTPVSVAINVAFSHLDDIVPADSLWKVRVQTDMYWDLSLCALDTRNQHICESRYGVYYFVVPGYVLQPLGATINANYTDDGVFAGDYVNSSCLKVSGSTCALF